MEMSTQIEARRDYFDNNFVNAVQVGTGRYGRVARATCRQDTNVKYAIKIIPVHNEPQSLCEVSILNEVKSRWTPDGDDDPTGTNGHQFVMKYQDAWTEENLPLVKDIKPFKTNAPVVHYLFLKCDFYLGRTLNSWLSDKKIDTAVGKNYIWQVTKGLTFLHSFRCLHRDLTPANIMVIGGGVRRQPGQVKIIDFGASRLEKDVACTGRGSLEFRSPEQRVKSEYGPPTDLFSLGMIFYAVLCPRLAGSDYLKEIRVFRDKFWNETDEFKYPLHFKNFDDEKSMIRSLVKVNPADRPTASAFEKIIEKSISFVPADGVS